MDEKNKKKWVSRVGTESNFHFVKRDLRPRLRQSPHYATGASIIPPGKTGRQCVPVMDQPLRVETTLQSALATA